jgi:hypothetical protein
MRSVENRLARKYTRRALVADMYSLHGHYDLARTWLNTNRDDTISGIEIVLSGGMKDAELRERFTSCLIAERYLRRQEYRANRKIEEAA